MMQSRCCEHVSLIKWLFRPERRPIHYGQTNTALVFAAFALLLCFPLCATAAPQNSRYNADYFSNTKVTAHTGQTFDFYNDLIRDKLVVINFIYLSCNDICPLTTARLSEVRSRLGQRAGKDIHFYSITMDPERDTPELLKEYAEAFDINDGWLFLTGKPDQLKKLRWRLGERSRVLVEHRNHLVLGNDRTGEWSRTSVYADVDSVVSKIKQLRPEWWTEHKHAPRQSVTLETDRIQPVKGQALFQKACATCHSIGGGDRVGPDLKNVSLRRTRTWLSAYLIAPDEMRANGDPIANQIDAAFPGVVMPNLGLAENDVGDLLSYIQEISAGRSNKKAEAQINTPTDQRFRP